jgi:hypothetical protein
MIKINNIVNKILGNKISIDKYSKNKKEYNQKLTNLKTFEIVYYDDKLGKQVTKKSQGFDRRDASKRLLTDKNGQVIGHVIKY